MADMLAVLTDRGSFHPAVQAVMVDVIVQREILACSVEGFAAQLQFQREMLSALQTRIGSQESATYSTFLHYFLWALSLFGAAIVITGAFAPIDYALIAWAGLRLHMPVWLAFMLIQHFTTLDLPQDEVRHLQNMWTVFWVPTAFCFPFMESRDHPGAGGVVVGLSFGVASLLWFGCFLPGMVAWTRAKYVADVWQSENDKCCWGGVRDFMKGAKKSSNRRSQACGGIEHSLRRMQLSGDAGSREREAGAEESRGVPMVMDVAFTPEAQRIGELNVKLQLRTTSTRAFMELLSVLGLQSLAVVLAGANAFIRGVGETTGAVMAAWVLGASISFAWLFKFILIDVVGVDAYKLTRLSLSAAQKLTLIPTIVSITLAAVCYFTLEQDSVEVDAKIGLTLIFILLGNIFIASIGAAWGLGLLENFKTLKDVWCFVRLALGLRVEGLAKKQLWRRSDEHDTHPDTHRSEAKADVASVQIVGINGRQDVRMESPPVPPLESTIMTGHPLKGHRRGNHVTADTGVHNSGVQSSGVATIGSNMGEVIDPSSALVSLPFAAQIPVGGTRRRLGSTRRLLLEPQRMLVESQRLLSGVTTNDVASSMRKIEEDNSRGGSGVPHPHDEEGGSSREGGGGGGGSAVGSGGDTTAGGSGGTIGESDRSGMSDPKAMHASEDLHPRKLPSRCGGGGGGVATGAVQHGAGVRTASSTILPAIIAPAVVQSPPVRSVVTVADSTESPQHHGSSWQARCSTDSLVEAMRQVYPSVARRSRASREARRMIRESRGASRASRVSSTEGGRFADATGVFLPSREAGDGDEEDMPQVQGGVDGAEIVGDTGSKVLETSVLPSTQATRAQPAARMAPRGEAATTGRWSGDGSAGVDSVNAPPQTPVTVISYSPTINGTDQRRVTAGSSADGSRLQEQPTRIRRLGSGMDDAFATTASSLLLMSAQDRE